MQTARLARAKSMIAMANGIVPDGEARAAGEEKTDAMIEKELEELRKMMNQ